jgi:outer membrane protein
MAALAMAIPVMAQAQAAQPFGKGTLLVTGRVTSVSSDANDPILTRAGAPSGLHFDISYDVMPTLGFTYFLTDHVSVEAILGATQHTVRAQGGTTDVAVHKTWVLPPVVTLQYRPLTGAGPSPYVGAGVNAMVFFSGRNRNGFDVNLDNALGLALQAGVDVPLQNDWTLNADVKKVFVKTDASINGGALKGSVKLDPWVLSLGVGHRF